MIEEKNNAEIKTETALMPIFHCAYKKKVALVDLKPNPRNPNKHPQRQIKMLAEIIKQSGWRAPITVSTRSGFIVRGHGRLLEALELGLAEAPMELDPVYCDVIRTRYENLRTN
jgi:hypothetical protein